MLFAHINSQSHKKKRRNILNLFTSLEGGEKGVIPQPSNDTFPNMIQSPFVFNIKFNVFVSMLIIYIIFIHPSTTILLSH